MDSRREALTRRKSTPILAGPLVPVASTRRRHMPDRVVSRRRLIVAFARVLAFLCVPIALCSCDASGEPDARTQPVAAGEWRYLFDGKTLKGWEIPDWGGSGKVYVKDGVVHMERGETGTGVTYTRDIPREDYEIELDGMRVEDEDFFCGLTFPVGKDQMSLILGGWDGTVSGLSCLEGFDASSNETTQLIQYEKGRWYTVRVRVTRTHIICWLDDKEIISLDRKDRQISIRSEVDLSVPLGIATWKTHGAARNIRIRTLTDADK
jgi:hypothetical protein